MSTRIQLRGICPICLKEHATKNGKMVSHGYIIHWHTQEASCYGSHAPHLGHKDAIPFIEKAINNLEDEKTLFIPARIRELEKQLSKVEDHRTAMKRGLKSNIRELESKLKAIPETIEAFKKRIEDWKPAELRKVDVDIEEAEARKQRESDASAKKEAKAKAQAEKDARKAERERKAAEKEALLLSNQWRQVFFDGEMVLEYQASYSNSHELHRDFGDKAREFAATSDKHKELESVRLKTISRTGQGKAGRQLEKEEHWFPLGQ